ncbi:hypothetical protein F2P81_023177 [Scophthalmus maximus]|uniref:Uncharacterized protein n=1 Tax=Scophthalmus maximus TaxID=52904 RepID=A0A6A4RW04_SCOMX|nr:hypothetical protein F2P81_023177 [Scophthalmus maximus]
MGRGRAKAGQLWDRKKLDQARLVKKSKRGRDTSRFLNWETDETCGTGVGPTLRSQQIHRGSVERQIKSAAVISANQTSGRQRENERPAFRLPPSEMCCLRISNLPERFKRTTSQFSQGVAEEAAFGGV